MIPNLMVSTELKIKKKRWPITLGKNYKYWTHFTVVVNICLFKITLPEVILMNWFKNMFHYFYVFLTTLYMIYYNWSLSVLCCYMKKLIFITNLENIDFLLSNWITFEKCFFISVKVIDEILISTGLHWFWIEKSKSSNVFVANRFYTYSTKKNKYKKYFLIIFGLCRNFRILYYIPNIHNFIDVYFFYMLSFYV